MFDILLGLCGKDEYRCGNGQCIKNILQCNGRPDCWDSSDETECGNFFIMG